MTAQNPQVGVWASPDGNFVVRKYADGTLTAETKVDGVYTGEIELRRDEWETFDAPVQCAAVPVSAAVVE